MEKSLFTALKSLKKGLKIMNKYTLRLKDLLWSLDTFENVQVVEDLNDSELGSVREIILAEDIVGEIEHSEEYNFLRENDYAVVHIMTLCGGKNGNTCGITLRISVKEFDE